MLWANLAVVIVAYFFNSYYSGRLLGYSSWMQLRDIAPSLAVATVTALSVYFLKFLPLNYWVVLPLQIVLGMLVFFGLCKINRMEELEEIKTIVMNKKRAKRTNGNQPNGRIDEKDEQE
jgi:hypothetical protein